MALTPSTMLPLGTPLPLALLQERLTPVHGGPLRPEALAGRPVLVLFLCPHCPFLKHVEAEISRLQADHGPGSGLPCDGRDLRAALTALAAGSPVPLEQTASIGCNIRWHPGQEPAWAH